MRRRDFIAGVGGAIAGASSLARAQQHILPVVGTLALIPPAFAVYYPNFKQGVNDLGFEEDKSVAFDYRWTARPGGLPALAAELVAKRVQVIVTFSGTPTAMAAKDATSNIPIVVLVSGDPVQLGLVSSWNRPDGNITGVALMQAEMAAKQLQILSEILPHDAVLGMMIDPNSDEGEMQTAVRSAASSLDRTILALEARTADDFETVFRDLSARHAAGLVVTGSAFFATHHQEIAALASKYRLPALYSFGDVASSGALMTYGANLPVVFRQLGHYVGKLLGGAKPGDLPVERPERIELRLNLKTAKALRLTIPLTLLARADEVIE